MTTAAYDRSVTRRRTDLLAHLRPAVAVLAVVAVLALAGCGVEAGNEVASTAERATTSTTGPGGSEPDPDGADDSDDAESPGDSDGGGSSTTAPRSTTEPDDTTTTTAAPGGGATIDDQVRDALIEGFESAGLTNEQATCLADGYIDLGLIDPDNVDAAEDLDVMEMMTMFSQCGISLEDLGELGAGLGG